MDATEPDLVQPSPPTLETLRRDIDKTAIGTASRVMNAYSLANSQAVYDGQRRAAPDQRVFILTRSGFAGIQRYATVTWSGDITSEWTTLRKQITAGLGFSIAGDPYWTTDTGGYTMQNRFTRTARGTATALDEWRELNARWFQYSTFTPILRVHGTDRAREMWNIGDETHAGLPVGAASSTSCATRSSPTSIRSPAPSPQDGYTMMRPLVMDFRDDVKARDVADQFMFGPALLVNPVTEYKARSRQVYLPAGATWYDFWTGAASPAARPITADAPYDQIPLFVRAGIDRAVRSRAAVHRREGRARADALRLRRRRTAVLALRRRRRDLRVREAAVLAHSDYLERGRARRSRSDAARARFNGMLTDRTFNVVLVSPGTPIGLHAVGARRAGRRVPRRGGLDQVLTMAGPRRMAALLALLLLASVTLRTQGSPATPAPAPAAPVQPLPYSHKTHVALGLECRTCHVNPDPGKLDDVSADRLLHGMSSVDRRRPAGDPEAGGIRGVGQAGALGPCLSASRLRVLEARDASQGGVTCAECHGPVAERDVIAQETNVVTMVGCLACHDKRQVFTDCGACHEPR